MLDKLKAVESRYEELCARSEQPDFYADPKKAAALLREKNDLDPIIEAFKAYNTALQDMADAQELMSDPDMKELCQQTYQEAKQAMEDLKAEFNERIHNNIVKHEQEMLELEKTFNKHLEELREKMRRQESELNDVISTKVREIEEAKAMIARVTEDYDVLLNEKRVCEARIKALRTSRGETYPEDEFIQKESFDELEQELEAFVKFYDERWGKVKKSIRKKLLNYQSLKGQSGQK